MGLFYGTFAGRSEHKNRYVTIYARDVDYAKKLFGEAYPDGWCMVYSFRDDEDIPIGVEHRSCMSAGVNEYKLEFLEELVDPEFGKVDNEGFCIAEFFCE